MKKLGRKAVDPKKRRTTFNVSCTQEEAKFLDKIHTEGKNKSHFILKAIHKTVEFREFLKDEGLTFEDINKGKHKSFFDWELKWMSKLF